jgi:hypothetical protein
MYFGLPTSLSKNHTGRDKAAIPRSIIHESEISPADVWFMLRQK